MADKFDVFISHASEDKEVFVRSLAEALRRLGVSVWYDELSLNVGDSISRGIDKGIAGARFGIVVISKAFIEKSWPEHELRGLVSREIAEDLKILPVWLGVSRADVLHFSPSLADKLAIDMSRFGAEEATIKLLRTIRPDLYDKHPRAELEALAGGEAVARLQATIDELREFAADYQCPYCSSPLSSRVDAPMDMEEKHWDIVETFDCGFRRFGGSVDYPCPMDPRFPKFSDYRIECTPPSIDQGEEWMCVAWPETPMARKVHLETCQGKTEEIARRKLEGAYLYSARKITGDQWFRIQMGMPER